MKNVFVFNDRSETARHATDLAFYIAEKMETNIIMANTIKLKREIFETAPAGYIEEKKEEVFDILPVTLPFCKSLTTEFIPIIKNFDCSNLDQNKLVDFINKNNVWLIVKGIADGLPSEALLKIELNPYLLLNKVLSPLLLVPLKWDIKPFERLAYIADLRYCRIQVIKFLSELAKSCKATLSIANVAAKGLPVMNDSYANTLFNEEIIPKINYNQMRLSNINEKNLSKVVDVLINGLRNDLLVLINHHYHIDEILGDFVDDKPVISINTPVLIFPY